MAYVQPSGGSLTSGPSLSGIIRARHDTTVPVISDAAYIAMFMVDEHSVLRYWLNTTRNHLDLIDSPLFPWVDMTIGADTSRAKLGRPDFRRPDHPPATVAWTVGSVPATGTSGTVDVPVDEVTFTVEYTIDPVVF